MAKLQMLSFEDDVIIARRIKVESNYRDVAHLYVATYGICQVILQELSPIDLDGNGRLTICANVEKPNVTPGYKNWAGTFGVSTYDLDRDTSRRLYEFKEFGEEFAEYVANLVLDVLTEVDEANGGSNQLARRRGEIMRNLRDRGFEKKVLLDRHSKLSRDRKHRAMVYNCFSQKVGDALKVEIVSTATGEVVATKWDEDLPRCAYSRKSAINKTGWDGDTFRVSIGRPTPFDEITIKLP
ncbi:MAG: hypothetical protein NC301_09090 [Bacteroides sp.]|nr:hypothetical protein [Alistipes timonensis]MCM1311156.1 hypothetical protein [Bacteroides sp.]MCM1406066.1 hypothetical protein [[Clostridium] fimetarium]